MTKFSVLMPVYHKDNPDFFEKALHSIYTDQTVKPNEIVIVVDGFVGNDLQYILDKWKNLKDTIFPKIKRMIADQENQKA